MLLPLLPLPVQLGALEQWSTLPAAQRLLLPPLLLL
jgi:hypothetical protein